MAGKIKSLGRTRHPGILRTAMGNPASSPCPPPPQVASQSDRGGSVHLVKQSPGSEQERGSWNRCLKICPKASRRSSTSVPDPGTMVHGPPAGLDGFRVRGVRDWIQGWEEDIPRAWRGQRCAGVRQQVPSRLGRLPLGHVGQWRPSLGLWHPLEGWSGLEAWVFDSLGVAAVHPHQLLGTAVRGHLPLLIDQQQDKGKAENSDNAGARGQGRSRDAVTVLLIRRVCCA